MPKKKRHISEFTEEPIKLNASSRRMFTRIRNGVQEGESGASILKRARASGLKIGNEQFYRTVRLAKAYNESGKALKFGRNDSVLSDNLIPIVPQGINMRGNYQYILELTSKSKIDDEEKSIFITVRSAQGLSKTQIRNQAQLIIESSNSVRKETYEDLGDDFSIDFVEAFRRV